MTTDLDTLFTEMTTLARHDRGFVVFGANGHGWEVDPVPLADVEAFEQAHGVTLPADYRRWTITTVSGIGAGPFYGFEGLPTETGAGLPFDPTGPEPLDGTVLLTSQGCGYTDSLVLAGPHAGEVWADFREGGGPVERWYPSFVAWLGAWLRRSVAEWASAVIPEGELADDADPMWVDRCRSAVERVLADVDDPMLAQYPLPHDKLHLTLAVLALRDGRIEDAKVAFERSAETSREPDGVRALAACLVAEAGGDEVARLAAADAGLASPTLWYTTRLRLLRHRRFALEGLERWDEAVGALEAFADAANELHAEYDVAWIRLLRGEAPLAKARLVRAAERGLGCDRQTSMAERLAAVAEGLLVALRGAGRTEEVAALEKELADG